MARKVVANYLSSAKLGDMIDVRSELLQMKAASFILKQTIKKDEKKIFEMEITLAFISFEGKPQKIDAETKKLITDLF